MPRIIASLAIVTALLVGTFILKNKSAPAASQTSLIAGEIQNANQSSLEAYAAELQASGAASGTTLIIPPTVSDIATTSGPITPPTATDKLAQNILETYVSAKQSGVTLNTDIATQIADNVLSQQYADSSSVKTYQMANLNIETTSSKTAIRNYGNSIGKAFSLPLPKDGENELAIFSNFAVTNDETLLPKLDENVSRYKKIIAALLVIPVPTPFAQSDLALVNTLSEITYEIGKMRDFPTDPVGGQNAAQEYQTTFASLAAIFKQEKSLFLSNGISFSPSESGYFLTQ
jgi:hypothetical protein